MERKQRTIRTSQSCQGVGLHTGVKTVITFHPAPENSGIRFIRSDITDCTEIKADIDHVVDISRGTTIEEPRKKQPLRWNQPNPNDMRQVV